MARIRTIKPELARHRVLFDLERETGAPFRFIWAMFPTVCDREGRFRWRPWDLKLDIAPYDEIDFGAVMDRLHAEGMIERYEHDGQQYGVIPTFLKHQTVNLRESASSLPSPHDENSKMHPARARTCMHVHARGEGKGREGKGREGGESKSEAPLSANADPHPLAAIWNENAGKLARVRGWNRARQRAADLRWAENPSTEYWTEVVKTIASSAFCGGKNDRGWRADFNWLLQPDVHLKVSEGRYGGRAQPPSQQTGHLTPGEFVAQEQARKKAELEAALNQPAYGVKHGTGN